MKIEFVNHASIIVTAANVRLITDPWMEGNAFHEGWGLIAPTKFAYSDFATITHIWFSHEHPDHFCPANLKAIPEEFRKRITVLFHFTQDKKVIEFCKRLGFAECMELPDSWVELNPGFRLLNVPHTDGDSWLCIQSENQIVLNTNDCVLEDAGQIKDVLSRIGTDKIDVLFTQFSYANWAGNVEDCGTRRQYAVHKVKEIDRLLSIIKPVYVVPFASYIWFCHSENFYMNDEVNRIDDIYAHIQQTSASVPVVLFTGEEWKVGDHHDSCSSVEQWMMAYVQNIREDKAVRPEYVPKADLLEAGKKFIKGLVRFNTFWMRLFLKPTDIYVADHSCAYRLSLRGLTLSSRNKDNCDIAMSSGALNYCFRYLWGGATTRINGRYQVPAHGKFYNWKLYFQTSERNNHGERFDLKFILESLYKVVRRRLYRTT